jgi:hypothetical protein
MLDSRMSLALFLLATLAIGCTDSPTTPPPVRQLTLVDGANQRGTPGEPLPRPVIVQLLGRDSVPLAGAAVTFRVTSGGGHVRDAAGLTDDAGRASAVWVLGYQSTVQQLVVSAPDAAPISITASTEVIPCAPAECPEEWGGEEPLRLLSIPTFEGSGQAVHPDVATWSGTSRLPLLMAFTPYPFGDAGAENPSLVESANARHWRVPAGLTNPVARPEAGHLSDPDLVFDPVEGVLHMYYREVSGGRNLIRHLTSRDGVAWLGGAVVLSLPSHGAVSPAVTRSGHDPQWSMWTVNSGAAGCSARSTTIELRRSGNGVDWSAPVVTDLVQPGQVIWHLDVQWVASRGEYWALYNSYPVGSTCVTRALFLARSADGVHWDTPTAPLLVAGVAPALRDVVYRSTFRLSPDGEWVELLVSGASYDQGRYDWRMGRVVVSLGGALNAGSTSDVPDESWRLPVPTHLPPPEPGDMP